MHTVDLSENDIQHIVAANEIVLVGFWASLCGPYLRFSRAYKRAVRAGRATQQAGVR